MSVLNTNIASLMAQQNLYNSQSALATSMQRLSSGLRINSAKDDAAGLAISDRFTTQINGIDQAVLNASNGTSLAQTGGGALSEVTNNLQRIRALAVESANSTNSASDRAALDQEVQQRLAQINQIANTTSFNGQKILNGSFGNATFQVGANAGETIGLNLTTSVGTNSIGALASTTSQSLGATASGGSIAATNSTLLYGTSAANATSGRIAVTAGTRLFGTTASAQVDGKNEMLSATGAAYDFSAATAVKGNNLQNDTVFDFSGTGKLAQMNIDGTAITLNASYTNIAGVAGAIQTQLQAATATATYTAAVVNGAIKITSSAAGAVAVTTADVNALAAGFANTTGNAGGADRNATFSVDGTGVTLNTAVTSQATLVSGLNTALTTAGLTGYVAAVDGAGVKITHTGSTTAVAITAANASAVNNGIVNSAGTAGTVAVSANNATFTIDSQSVNLNQDYGSYDLVAAAISTQMNAGPGPGTYTVTNNNGAMTISRATTGVGSAAVGITAANLVGTNAGFAVAPGTQGADAVPTTNASFKVDGHIVSLATNYGNQGALISYIGTQLGAGYTVSSTGGSNVTITNNTLASGAVAITANTDASAGAQSNAITDGFGAATGTAGLVGGSITLGTSNFTIVSGTDPAVDMSGSYTSTQVLADAINAKVNNIYASVTNNGSLQLTSSNALTLAGTKATATGAGNLGFASDTVAVSSGSMSTSNALTVASSNTLIQQCDSALSSVSTLNSTFGAIQNRFASTISNLQTTSQNLTSARSAILDTNFAAETANLTRNQILVQAGTAMLAQANTLPQSILALLK